MSLVSLLNSAAQNLLPINAVCKTLADQHKLGTKIVSGLHNSDFNKTQSLESL